ncbi:MAG: glycerate kinase [Vallitaleaceae bacterium]|nr:glycerate kinase [Vallitaleaceae bacterium]
MKIILAPDSFKGTFSSKEVINYLDQGFRKFIENVEIIHVPIADGGEGTVEAILTATEGKKVDCIVSGPLGQKVKAYYGLLGDTAVIEMATASGITLIADEEKNPLKTSTYGTGEMMLHALDNGAKKLVIGIGGSATNDGGLGMAKALGVKFYNKDHAEVGHGGIELGNISTIDITGMDKRFKNIEVDVICDVTNPLLGPNGATYTYGPQKGATTTMMVLLENGMVNYHNLIQETFGIHLDSIPGTGAAGGLGGGLVAFVGAVLKPGIETILDVVAFDEKLENVDLVITGEGKLDGQSIYGKVPVGVAARCGNIPVLAFVGSIGDGGEKVYDHNISGVFSTVSDVTSFEEILRNKEKIMEQGVERFVRLIKTGMRIKKR